MTLSLSIVIPVLNESASIEACLQSLQPLRKLGAKVIVVDGGSDDDTVALCKGGGADGHGAEGQDAQGQGAQAGADQVIICEPGRARQMNAGAALAKSKWILFLHADTRLPKTLPKAAMAWDYSRSVWGFFFVRLESDRLAFRFIEWFMNRRAYYTGISTGDQCQFVQREVFEQVGGFADIPLMEDVDLSKRLKRLTRPLIVVAKATTSARKWLDGGVLATMLLMWRIRLRYFLGASPELLADRYYRPGKQISRSNNRPS